MDSARSCIVAREMAEAPRMLRAFDASAQELWARDIARHGRIFLTGEGSSRIFPAGNMTARARQLGCSWEIRSEGARQAAETNLSGFRVLGASSSGRTRELVSLFGGLKKAGNAGFSVVAAAGSPLEEVSAECKTLSCGAGDAVAATKSVFETALVYQSLLQGPEWSAQEMAADICHEILSRPLPDEIVSAVAGARMLYFAGRSDGVAAELSLKANEIVRKKSLYLEGTYVLHGIEETMCKDETVILIEPFREEMERYRHVLTEGVGLSVVAVSSFETPFPTLRLPALDGFDGYFRLLAGWNMLLSAALASGIDPDKPLRARKIGNAV